MKDLSLRYGTNPNQVPARLYRQDGGKLPLTVLGGAPGYINLLDALNAWQLVRDLKQVLGLPAAASFKHVSPSGTALGLPLSAVLKKAYFVEDMQLSTLACAYARARGTDRMSSFGDFIGLSDPVDVSTARLIAREVSDGVIAPDYEPEALEILKSKKQGKYVVLQINRAYEPPPMESRQVFGLTLEQHRNDRPAGRADLANIVTRNKDLPESAARDMLLAWITLKYTQSNSVCYVLEGQTIGVGAGQQSRVHCVRMAGAKADLWRLRQHPAVLGLEFREGVRRPDRDNAIDQLLQPDVTETEKQNWAIIFKTIPDPLTTKER
ncbi:MAG TPA: phosphoribosylaminoimidazolecarboxamide formyltransferase, partial [Anaerolineales bacterium]|nr:phosphoribosylaminoimidazolecarboxamide formyltransferase [Anaerolineales bacterium]